MRLIDADYLKEKGRYDDFDVFVVDYDDIKNAPTIDPIKHGRWIEQEHGDWRYSKEYRCSECGKYRLVTTPVGWEWHYCPNCGAKMDEEE